jgi:type 1 fimbriae regulatory protein FimB/type 1 fimbriae regulatory protein FimE
MVLVAYRHGLRPSELVDLRWDQVDFRTASLHVCRVKLGSPSVRGMLVQSRFRVTQVLQSSREHLALLSP